VYRTEAHLHPSGQYHPANIIKCTFILSSNRIKSSLCDQVKQVVLGKTYDVYFPSYAFRIYDEARRNYKGNSKVSTMYLLKLTRE
jgi:hypothetical protein